MNENITQHIFDNSSTQKDSPMLLVVACLIILTSVVLYLLKMRTDKRALADQIDDGTFPGTDKTEDKELLGDSTNLPEVLKDQQVSSNPLKDTGKESETKTENTEKSISKKEALPEKKPDVTKALPAQEKTRSQPRAAIRRSAKKLPALPKRSRESRAGSGAGGAILLPIRPSSKPRTEKRSAAVGSSFEITERAKSEMKEPKRKTKEKRPSFKTPIVS